MIRHFVCVDSLFIYLFILSYATLVLLEDFFLSSLHLLTNSIHLFKQLTCAILNVVGC